MGTHRRIPAGYGDWDNFWTTLGTTAGKMGVGMVKASKQGVKGIGRQAAAALVKSGKLTIKGTGKVIKTGARAVRGVTKGLVNEFSKASTKKIVRYGKDAMKVANTLTEQVLKKAPSKITDLAVDAGAKAAKIGRKIGSKLFSVTGAITAAADIASDLMFESQLDDWWGSLVGVILPTGLIEAGAYAVAKATGWNPLGVSAVWEPKEVLEDGGNSITVPILQEKAADLFSLPPII